MSNYAFDMRCGCTDPTCQLHDDGRLVTICDGCNVRQPWEHRCHGGPPIMVCGDRIDAKCGCTECQGGTR